jgi:Cu/Ag efflux protein CusF
MRKCGIASTIDGGSRLKAFLIVANRKENNMRFISEAALAPRPTFLLIIVLGSLPLGIVGCHSSESHPTASSEAQAPAPPATKTYHLEGTVVSIDRPQKRVVVDGKDIPGFMAAMTMPYPVVDDQNLDRLKPGDQITADVVATSSDVHLDNIVVVKKSDAQK